MHTIGLYDKKLQEHLLRESNLDLNKMVEVCKIVEVTCSQAHVIQHSTAVNPDYNVNKIHRQFSNNQESQKESPDLIRKCKFVHSSIRQTHVQHMENFVITGKTKIILQNAAMPKKLTMFTNIRTIPNQMKIARFLKLKLYLGQP